MREIFNRVEDNELVKIEVELDAKENQDFNPWLFSIFIKYDGVNDSEESLTEFFEVKESIIMSLESGYGVNYVGNRLIDNWSEMYFYAADSKGLESKVNDILKASGYIYECNVVRDTKWEYFDFNIYPTALEVLFILSNKIIYMLEEEGDILSRIREVEHYVSFETSTQKDRFIKNAEVAGFKFKDDLSTDEFEHGVALIKEHAVTEEDMIHIISELYTLIEEERGEYELWSTTLHN